MTLLKLAMAPLVLAVGTLGDTTHDVSLVVNGKYIAPVHTKMIDGKLYIQASSLAQAMKGTVTLSKGGNALYLSVSNDVSRPSLTSVEGSWTWDHTRAWGTKVVSWCEKTSALLNLVDESGITSEDEAARERYIDYLNALKTLIDKLKMDATMATATPVVVIRLSNLLALVPIQDITDPHEGALISGTPSPELAVQLNKQALEATKLSTEITPHAQAVEQWYDDNCSPSWW